MIFKSEWNIAPSAADVGLYRNPCRRILLCECQHQTLVGKQMVDIQMYKILEVFLVFFCNGTTFLLHIPVTLNTCEFPNYVIFIDIFSWKVR